MKPRTIEASLVLESRCLLGEGPFWHQGRVWWVDIERGLLLSSDEQGNTGESIDFGQRVGSVVPFTQRSMLAALEREIVEVNLETKAWRTIAKPDSVPDAGRFNDGKCDPRGRFIVGTTTPKAEKVSSLYSLHQDYNLRLLRGRVGISNGLAWSLDGSTMYYIDSTIRSVFAYDYDLHSGTISRERAILQFSEEPGLPDGMTIDQKGRLWIAFWDGWAVRCYDPSSGRCEAVVSVPCARPTSCCFGGEDMSRLFITSAGIGIEGENLALQPLAGSIFVCAPDAAGSPPVAFQGDQRRTS